MTDSHAAPDLASLHTGGPLNSPTRRAPTTGTWVFCTRQYSRDPANHELVHAGDIEGQTRRVLDNLKAVLEEAGAALADVVQLRVYLRNITYSPIVANIRREYFTQERPEYPLAELPAHCDHLIRLGHLL